MRNWSAHRVNGIGKAWLGVRNMDDRGFCTATLWITFLWLPIFPLARAFVQFTGGKKGATGSRVIRELPRNAKEIVITYLAGLILCPMLIFGPFLFLGNGGIMVLSHLPDPWDRHVGTGLIVMVLPAIYFLMWRTNRPTNPLKTGKESNRPIIDNLLQELSNSTSNESSDS